ncbi:MAG: hypothetical protein JOZ38_12645 [Candidatus Eremiobacteraeota bacterium]|nr:hypothetical protein [Candidatus Eremiobacteraeota bacterium]
MDLQDQSFPRFAFIGKSIDEGIALGTIAFHLRQDFISLKNRSVAKLGFSRNLFDQRVAFGHHPLKIFDFLLEAIDARVAGFHGRGQFVRRLASLGKQFGIYDVQRNPRLARHFVAQSQQLRS